MSQPSEHPLETILLAIAAAAPEPWYYQAQARRAGVEPGVVVELLELLWLEGLIQKGPESPQTGPSVQLTPVGQQVLEDPEALERLRQGVPVSNDQGAVIRNSLRQPVTPVVTRLLLVANFAVFGYCIWLARGNQQLLMAYIGGQLGVKGVIDQVLHPAGSVSVLDVIRGEWWRLLTCCFVHGGALHILMNMYTLHVAGGFVEQTWGRWRYLVIYLLSGWGGSCLAMAYSPTPALVGASGALCGILAADGVWIYLNGKHLPRAMAKRGKRGFVTTLLLMIFISLLPGISGWAHLGGAVVGAAAAVIFHYQRFGPAPVRWLGLLALLPLPWLSYAHMQYERGRTRGWARAEERVFNDDYVRAVGQTMRPAIAAYRDVVKEVRERHPERREKEEVATAVKALDEQIVELDRLAARLEKAGPYRDAEIEDARRKALDYARARAELYREIRNCLEAGKEWKTADDKRLDSLWKEMGEKRKAWEALLE